jgi:hypothetical protein
MMWGTNLTDQKCPRLPKVPETQQQVPANEAVNVSKRRLHKACLQQSGEQSTWLIKTFNTFAQVPRRPAKLLT